MSGLRAPTKLFQTGDHLSEKLSANKWSIYLNTWCPPSHAALIPFLRSVEENRSSLRYVPSLQNLQDKLRAFLVVHMDAARSHLNLLSTCTPREKHWPRRGRRDAEEQALHAVFLAALQAGCRTATGYAGFWGHLVDPPLMIQKPEKDEDCLTTGLHACYSVDMKPEQTYHFQQEAGDLLIWNITELLPRIAWDPGLSEGKPFGSPMLEHMGTPSSHRDAWMSSHPAPAHLEKQIWALSPQRSCAPGRGEMWKGKHSDTASEQEENLFLTGKKRDSNMNASTLLVSRI